VIVRALKEIEGTDRDVLWGNGHSRRLLLERDQMGYSLTDTIVDAGSDSLLEYRNHLEACYCIEGEGEVEDERGQVYPLAPGTMYALDKHDRHHLRAKTRMRLVCVFVPPLIGTESHRLEGATKDGSGSGY
jgi:L-ectoine synthase